MTPDQYYEVEKFAKGLRECLESKLSQLEPEATICRSVLDYAISVLDVHLRMAEVEVDREIEKMAEVHGEHSRVN
jgi:hypothetical protein